MTQMLFFQKNLAIVGGLLYIMAYGSGQYSLGAHIKRGKRVGPLRHEEAVDM